MSFFSKQAPLETYLKGVTPVKTADGDVESSQEAKVSSPADSRRAVILTILHQADKPVARDELERRSELGEWYQKTVAELEAAELVAPVSDGVALTEAGKKVAALERDRLLSIGF